MGISSQLAAARTKTCPSCKITKQFTDYTIRANGKAASYCKPCSATKQKLYREKNYDKYIAAKRNARKKNHLKNMVDNKVRYWSNVEHERARYKKYYATHRDDIVETNRRRRAKRLGVATYRVTAREWRRVCHRYNWSCAYCGVRAKLSMDHVVPLARGGYHGIGNLLPACMRCNSSKNKKFLIEWRLVGGY